MSSELHEHMMLNRPEMTLPVKVTICLVLAGVAIVLIGGLL
jgi:hypothetical protein